MRTRCVRVLRSVYECFSAFTWRIDILSMLSAFDCLVPLSIYPAEEGDYCTQKTQSNVFVDLAVCADEISVSNNFMELSYIQYVRVHMGRML